ncbi:MAG: acetylxylan esterase [Candidatus Sumerlaeota bacterium]|nr:acetylxylan esterase [Candidatus Sumerlaeota bacterium]
MQVLALSIMVSLSLLRAGEGFASETMWDMKALSIPPAMVPAEGFKAPGMKAIFYDGLPFKGKPTRVFAWLGLPAATTDTAIASAAPKQKYPGIVLIHGGGGTAFPEWVQLWTARGYAAIAMDTCGCTAGEQNAKPPRHEMAGPAGGIWDQMDWPREDQWPYHAVADVILANSLLRSLPEVDPERVGMTGISWGGYLTCIVAGVDSRFKFAVPIYGCGDYPETIFQEDIARLGKEKADRWMRWWEPSLYLKDAAMPMLWVDGSNDFAYWFPALQKSYRLPSGPRTLCIRLRMPHGHGGPGEKPKEIYAFAESIVNGAPALPKITAQGRDGDQIWVTYQSDMPILKAELNITKDKGKWPSCKWDALPARLETSAKTGKALATLPAGTTVYYMNLFASGDLVVSSEHVELP